MDWIGVLPLYPGGALSLGCVGYGGVLLYVSRSGAVDGLYGEELLFPENGGEAARKGSDEGILPDMGAGDWL